MILPVRVVGCSAESRARRRLSGALRNVSTIALLLLGVLAGGSAPGSHGDIAMADYFHLRNRWNRTWVRRSTNSATLSASCANYGRRHTSAVAGRSSKLLFGMWNGSSAGRQFLRKLREEASLALLPAHCQDYSAAARAPPACTEAM